MTRRLISHPEGSPRRLEAVLTRYSVGSTKGVRIRNMRLRNPVTASFVIDKISIMTREIAAAIVFNDLTCAHGTFSYSIY